MMFAVPVAFRCLGKILIIFSLIASGGCDSLFMGMAGASASLSTDYDDYNVQVIDGDTGEPISSAQVYTPPGEWGARGSAARTNAEGQARLRMARHVGGGFYADADGYLPGDFFTGRVSAKDSDVTLELYRPPAPLTGITVPKEYRGVVKVRVEERGDSWPAHSTWAPGQREFYTPIDGDGITVLIASPIPRGIERHGTGLAVARFDDGTPLRYENPIAAQGWAGEHLYGLPDIRDMVPPRTDGVALFNLGHKAEGPGPPFNGYQLYFVGTQDEAAAMQQEEMRGSVPLVPDKSPAAGQYTFKPRPLSIDKLPVGTELSPRWAG